MKEKGISIKKIKNVTLMHRSKLRHVYMSHITKNELEVLQDPATNIEEEIFIDNLGRSIKNKNIIFYGSINFKKNDDVKFLNKLNITSIDTEVLIPSDFDYDKNIIRTNDKGVVPLISAMNKENLYKYSHMVIGKPKFVVIYELYHQPFGKI